MLHRDTPEREMHAPSSGFQKSLRFLLRAYIACWLLAYVAVKRDFTVAVTAYAWVHTWLDLSPMMFVWLASFLLFAVVAPIYLVGKRKFF